MAVDYCIRSGAVMSICIMHRLNKRVAVLSDVVEHDAGAGGGGGSSGGGGCATPPSPPLTPVPATKQLLTRQRIFDAVHVPGVRQN